MPVSVCHACCVRVTRIQLLVTLSSWSTKGVWLADTSCSHGEGTPFVTACPGLISGAGWPQPLCEPAGSRFWVAGSGPFCEHLGPAGRAEPSARQGALLHHARLPCVSFQGQCAGSGRRRAVAHRTPAAPTLTLRPRSATPCEKSRDRARPPTPWLAFSHSSNGPVWE